MIAEASRILAAQRLTPRKKKEGAFDLTSSKVFQTSQANMQKVVAAVRQVVGAQIGGEPAGVVVHRIFLAFNRLHGFWRSKVYLSDAALAVAKEVQQLNLCIGVEENWLGTWDMGTLGGLSFRCFPKSIPQPIYVFHNSN